MITSDFIYSYFHIHPPGEERALTPIASLGFSFFENECSAAAHSFPVSEWKVTSLSKQRETGVWPI